MILLLHRWEAIQRLVISASRDGVTVARSVSNALDLLGLESGAYRVAIVEPVQYPAAVEVLAEKLPVIVLTHNLSREVAALAFSQGAVAVLGVDCTLQQLKGVIDDVVAGRCVARSEMVQGALGVLRVRQQEAGEINLSPRQRQVLALTARGLTAREIGEELGLSHRYVQNVRVHAYDKIGVGVEGQGRTQAAVRWAAEHGIV